MMSALLLNTFLFVLLYHTKSGWCTMCRLNNRGLTEDRLDAALRECNADILLLDLSNNRLASLDLVKLKQFRLLQFLDVKKNNLSEIPDQINENLPNLRELFLERNHIEHLSSTTRSNHLMTLKLSYNRITYVPSNAFSGFSSLKELYLTGNKIQKLAVDSFTDLPYLQKLYLDKNKIETLYSGVLNKMMSLQVFNAAHNKLQRIRNGVLTNLRYLNEIILNDNEIVTLDGRSFQRLRIATINLRNNRLTSVKNSVFLNALVYGKILLQGNPLVCDCWLIEENIAKLRGEGEMQGMCDAPLHLKGRNIISLTRPQLSCKVTNSCLIHECMNDAFCKQINATSYECECNTNFHGNRCQHPYNDNNYTVLIILGVCLGVVLIIAIVVGVIVRTRKNRNVHNRCISKETCCCFMILGVFFFLFVLFVGLRVACRFYEYC